MKFRLALVLGLVAAGLVTVMPTAHGQNFNVDDADDTHSDGSCGNGMGQDCTLRDAVDETNGNDRITLQTNVTYELVGSPLALTTGNNNEWIGNGATVSGGPGLNNRLMTIGAGAEIAIENTTFEEGDVPSPESGGAILNDGSLTITNSTFRDNAAGVSGGAISSTGPLLSVTNVTFDENAAADGGALDLQGEVFITNSRFIHNDASARGGAITITTDGANEQAVITGTTFDDNEALIDAGAISSDADPQNGFRITRSVFTNNNAFGDGTQGFGGAIFNQSGGNMTIQDSTFDLNTADAAGGAIATEAGGTTLTIERSTFSNNAAADILEADGGAKGGGIYDTGSSLTIRNSTFSGNTSEDDGGGLYTFGTPSIEGSTFTGNRADFADTDVTIPSTGDGGAFFGLIGDIPVEGSILFGNSDDTTDPGGTVEDTCGSDAFDDNGGNVVENDGVCDIVTASTVNPNLGPLANNGGPTRTHAVPGGSSAVDFNDTDCNGLGTDQRGAARPSPTNCDSGAYERVFCNAQLVNVIGTDGDDVLGGTAGNDGILGGDGKDTINAGNGNDRVCGGNGDDRISGGGGKDRLFGEAGKDALNGGKKKDKCFGGPQNDTFRKCEKAKQ